MRNTTERGREGGERGREGGREKERGRQRKRERAREREREREKVCLDFNSSCTLQMTGLYGSATCMFCPVISENRMGCVIVLSFSPEVKQAVQNQVIIIMLVLYGSNNIGSMQCMAAP